MSTPLMKQYFQAKARYPDTILLLRMGDFYETSEEDAKVTARVLGITLTKPIRKCFPLPRGGKALRWCPPTSSWP